MVKQSLVNFITLNDSFRGFIYICWNRNVLWHYGLILI